jgi:RNA-directed DNA polymerase
VMPVVVKNALEPRFEAECEAQSSGFRPGRCCQAAIAEVCGALNHRAVGHNHDSLDADLQGAFDPIRQACLRHRIGPLPGRELITHWRNAGSGERGPRPHTTEGTPQGGVRRPWVATIALEGLATQLGTGDRVARYADDLVGMAKSLPAIAQAGPVVPACLAARGLALHRAKPRLVQRTEGGDVLGLHGQMRGQKLLITPQKQKVHALLQEVRSWRKPHQTVAAEVVLRHLNPRIRGWALYDRHVVSQHTFQQVDDPIWRALWRWVKRRHPKKPQRWV